MQMRALMYSLILVALVEIISSTTIIHAKRCSCADYLDYGQCNNGCKWSFQNQSCAGNATKTIQNCSSLNNNQQSCNGFDGSSITMGCVINNNTKMCTAFDISKQCHFYGNQNNCSTVPQRCLWNSTVVNSTNGTLTNGTCRQKQCTDYITIADCGYVEVSPQRKAQACQWNVSNNPTSNDQNKNGNCTNGSAINVPFNICYMTPSNLSFFTWNYTSFGCYQCTGQKYKQNNHKVSVAFTNFATNGSLSGNNSTSKNSNNTPPTIINQNAHQSINYTYTGQTILMMTSVLLSIVMTLL